MNIYDFVNSINDCENIIFTLFDCNKTECVVVSTEDGEKIDLNVDELMWSDYTEYEIGGIDMWIDNGKIRIEFNIDVDEEDE